MTPNRPLVRLLCEPACAARAVAFGPGPGGICHHARLLADVFSLADALDGDCGRRWLVESEDAYRIAVSVLAASLVGARVALPPNLQPGTLRDLRSRCDRVFVAAGSGAECPAGCVDPLDPSSVPDAPPASLRVATLRAGDAPPFGVTPHCGQPATSPAIDRQRPLVDLFTSGTSGPGKLVTKALCHLEDEVVELERVFGAAIGRDAAVLATVSAHHLYGLLLRVLWPLASGRPFCRTSFLLPDELLARVAGAERAVVVSSPAHLRHLAVSARLVEQAPRIDAIFSSGGPLETATALALEQAGDLAPTEIFGSTETGGVAWRRAGKADPSPRWTPLPAVSIEEAADGSLVVTSPFVTAPGGADTSAPQTWRMGDRIEKDGDGFRLLGRIDRIAKVGEKTLSLPEIEAWLAAHVLVEAAVVGTYHDKSGLRLGAVVVPSTDGRRCLAGDGRRALQGVLADHLAERWDRVALPRRWRFVEALPSDDRGKLAQQTVEDELARPVDAPREPLRLAEQREGDEIRIDLVVPRDLAYFAGHYDAFPLVPGAVQIHWVMLALARVLARPVSAQRMEAIKFRNVLRPAQSFTMRLRIDAGAARVTFTLEHESRVFSSGRITLSA